VKRYWSACLAHQTKSARHPVRWRVAHEHFNGPRQAVAPLFEVVTALIHVAGNARRENVVESVHVWAQNLTSRLKANAINPLRYARYRVLVIGVPSVAQQFSAICAAAIKAALDLRTLRFVQSHSPPLASPAVAGRPGQYGNSIAALGSAASMS
jgi:hypothetical protein